MLKLETKIFQFEPLVSLCSFNSLQMKWLSIKKIFEGELKCWSVFFNENASIQSCNFIKRRLQHRCFPMNIATFFRTPVLKKICEQLFKHFPTWINNIASKKTFQNSARWKNIPFQDGFDHFVFLYFSNACKALFVLHNKKW